MNKNIKSVIDDGENRIPDGAAVPKLRQLARTNKNLIPFDELTAQERDKDIVIVGNQDYVLGRSETPVVVGASGDKG
jgi:hypothetical protein